MKKHQIFLILILAFAAITWSIRLGHLPLWEDEAHTALLGKSVLTGGLPKAWDGRNLVSGVQGEDFNEDLVVTWDQPLQFYVTALSIRVFGLHNWSVRLPFVVAGLLTILLLYLFARKLTGEINISLLAAFILSITILFILHSRQCRYYSLGTFFTLTLFISYLDLGLKRYAKYLFPVSLIFLFYSNLLMMVMSAGSLLIYHVIFERSWEKFRTMAICSLFSLPFILPWLIYSQLWAKSGPHAGASLTSRLLNIFEMSFKFNRAFFPILILAILIILLLRNKLSYDKKYYELIFTVLLSPLVLVPILLLPGIRYIIYIIPFCALLTALATAEIYKRRKVLAVLFLVLILFTKVFSNIVIILPQWGLALAKVELKWIKDLVAERTNIDTKKLDEAFAKAAVRIRNSISLRGAADNLLKMEYPGYIYDITHEYRDPIRGAAEFLKDNALPGDEVMIMVDAFPLMLYAPEFNYSYIAERNDKNNQRLSTLPDYVYSFDNVRWFIPRDLKKLKGPYLSEEEFVKWCGRSNKKYKKHVIDYFTFHWDGSRPESFSKYALQHSNRPIKDEKVVIYEVLR